MLPSDTPVSRLASSFVVHRLGPCQCCDRHPRWRQPADHRLGTEVLRSRA